MDRTCRGDDHPRTHTYSIHIVQAHAHIHTSQTHLWLPEVDTFWGHLHFPSKTSGEDRETELEWGVRGSSWTISFADAYFSITDFWRLTTGWMKYIMPVFSLERMLNFQFSNYLQPRRLKRQLNTEPIHNLRALKVCLSPDVGSEFQWGSLELWLWDHDYTLLLHSSPSKLLVLPSC